MIRLPLELIRQFKVEEGHEIYAAHVIDNSNSLLGYVLVGGKSFR
jgi:Mg/Co/Ni transporter MgtE